MYSLPGIKSVSSVSSKEEKEQSPRPPLPPKPQIKLTPSSRKPVAAPPSLPSSTSTISHSPENLERKETKENVDETATTRPVMKTKVPRPLPRERMKSPSPGFSPQNLDTGTAPTTPKPEDYCIPVESKNLSKSSPQPLEVVEELPPPIPEKTPLSRQLQMSVKINGSVPQSEASGFLSEEDIEDFESMSIVQNTSYLKIRSLSTSFSDPDLSTDKPEPLYTEPIVSKMISKPKKVKPTRPPPPSIRAIRRAQERKRAQTIVNQNRVSQKNSSRLFSSNTVKRSTFHSTVKHSTRSPRSSVIHSALPPIPSVPCPNPSVYEAVDFDEEVDTELEHYYTAPTDPAHSSPKPFKPHRVSQNMSVYPSPALPPRSPKSSNTEKRRIITNHTPKPSGFSLHQPKSHICGKKHTEERNEMKNPESEEEGDTSDFYEPVNSDKPEDCYELVDTSNPLPPIRTKKMIRGTRTNTMANTMAQTKQGTRVHAGQRLSQNVRSNQDNSRNVPLSRKCYTHSSSQQHTKLHTKLSLSLRREFGSHSESVSSEDEGSTKVLSMSTDDIGGIEEYVEMNKAWEGADEGKN